MGLLPPLNLLSVNTVSPSTQAKMITLWAKAGRVIEIRRIEAEKSITNHLLLPFFIDTSQKLRFYPLQECHAEEGDYSLDDHHWHVCQYNKLGH